jgi:CO dehydrogenase/acetyl-CoA synthase gamma subunit (corrinoid Fe-S protein)
MFSDYPAISENIFSFNIDVLLGDPDETLADDKIGHTIFHIFKLFFEKIENVAVYVCDTLDERHLSRKRKFDFWFWKFNDGSLLKEDGIAVIEGMPIYNSLLVHKLNKHWPEIVLAYSELNERAGGEK